ncbi:hypothetical protein HKD37_06G016032 [Glycine soja]
MLIFFPSLFICHHRAPLSLYRKQPHHVSATTSLHYKIAMMKAFASFSSPPFLGNGPRHCRPSSVDYFRQNKGIHLDLFHNTLLGSIKTNLNGFLGSACLTTTSLILGMILTMMAYIGANLDDGATVGIRDAEHEEEGIKAPKSGLRSLTTIIACSLKLIYIYLSANFVWGFIGFDWEGGKGMKGVCLCVERKSDPFPCPQPRSLLCFALQR